jgi:hypothetical protein
MPFAVPPLRAGLGAGTWDDSFSVPDATDPDEPGTTVLARAGIHPLQLVPELSNRLIDIGIGYGIEAVEGGDGTSAHRTGPYFELGAFPLRGSAGTGRRWRAGVLAVGDYSVASTGPLGDGSTLLAATAELTGFSRSTFATDDTVGVAFGEWGFGLFAGPTLRMGAAQTWSGSAGLTARIPMTLGVACCAVPDARGETTTRQKKRPSGKKEAKRRQRRR